MLYATRVPSISSPVANSRGPAMAPDVTLSRSFTPSWAKPPSDTFVVTPYARLRLVCRPPYVYCHGCVCESHRPGSTVEPEASTWDRSDRWASTATIRLSRTTMSTSRRTVEPVPSHSRPAWIRVGDFVVARAYRSWTGTVRRPEPSRLTMRSSPACSYRMNMESPEKLG
jgi:hypothetical protein